jgi:hypothetical protein
MYDGGGGKSSALSTYVLSDRLMHERAYLAAAITTAKP